MNANLENKESDSIIIFNDDLKDPDGDGWSEFLKIFFRNGKVQAILFLVALFVFLNFWLFRYDDFANGCHIKIYPSILELNNLQIKEAISLLKDRDYPAYGKLCSSVKTISPELACGGMGGGCYNKKRPNEIVVSTTFRSLEAHSETTAAIIAHEVCHLFQFKENRPLEEAECYSEYCRVLKNMGVREDYDSRCINIENK